MAQQVSAPGDASGTPDRQSGDGTQARRESVLDVAPATEFSAGARSRFVRGIARNGLWCEVNHRNTDRASRSLKREFEKVIMVDV
jgi:hypothetical protein